MLRVQNLSAGYGAIQALQGVSFAVPEGEIVAVIGANGAGKTTLMATLAGLIKPTGGQVCLRGQEITGLPAERVVRLGLALVPERRQVFDGLTGRENLVLGAYPVGARKADVDAGVERVLAIFPALRGKLDRLAGNLSGGEQQMLAIGRALMSRPAMLLIDELSLGLAPLVVQEILRVLKRLRDESGTTILMVEQNARAALKAADRAVVFERGAVALEGAPQELLNDPRVEAAYLGKGYRSHH